MPLFFGDMVSHLGQRLGPAESNTNRQAGPLPHTLTDRLAHDGWTVPELLHALDGQKTFIDRLWSMELVIMYVD